MTRFGTRTLAVLGAGLLAVALTAPTQAQSVKNFYKGKRLSVIIGSGVGGGYDTYTRTLGRHIADHIPGHPSIVNKNMPGAGSLLATNYLYHKAPRDGSEIGAIFNTISLEPLIGNRGARFDVFKFNWIGSMGKLQSICVTWHTSPIKTLKQAIGKELTVSATGATGNSATMPRIFNDLVGTKFKVIQGYSTSGSHLALEKGEVDGICGLGYSTLLASEPDWMTKGKLNILAQVGLHPLKSLPNVPMALDAVKDPAKKKVMELLLIRQEPGRPIIAPPGVPADRVAALRAAFNATMKDPKFLADAKRVKLMIDPLTADQITALLKRAYAYPKETVKAAAKLVGRPKQGQFVKCGKYTNQAKWCRKKKKKKKK